jgi:mono/diheme cytochrome c family protein
MLKPSSRLAWIDAPQNNSQPHARGLGPFAELLLALVAAASVTWAQAQPAPEPPPSRGQLLYTTHCIECHTTRMHWRNQRLARDWETLKAQVRLWQGVASLGWS